MKTTLSNRELNELGRMRWVVESLDWEDDDGDEWMDAGDYIHVDEDEEEPVKIAKGGKMVIKKPKLDKSSLPKRPELDEDDY